MARLLAAPAFIAMCGALSLERHDPDLDSADIRQFSETSRSMSHRIESGSIKVDRDNALIFGGQVGREAFAAEEAAAAARDAAAKAIQEDIDKGISERQMLAMDRHAESLSKKEEKEERLLENVVESMQKEANSESKAVEDLERVGEKLEGKQVTWQSGSKTEELHGSDGTWYEDPAFKNEALRERDQDAAFDHENAEANRLLVLARKQVDSAKAQERMELHRRDALERESRVRLEEEADVLRHEAAMNGTLSEQEMLQVLDISKKELDRITDTFSGWREEDTVSGSWIEGRLENNRIKASIASAKMLEAIRFKVNAFKAKNQDYDDHQFLSRLAQLLNESRAEITGVENFDDVLMARLRHWDDGNNETLTYNVALALQGVTRSVEFRNHLVQMDTTRLGHASRSEACGLLIHLVNASLQPVYKGVALQRTSLDSLSKIARSITAYMPTYIQTTMMNRTDSILNMAYVEHLVLKEAATVITQDAAPLVMERFGCGVSGAAGLGPALGALALAAAAWLAQ